MKAAVETGQCPSHLVSFWSLSKISPDLFRKLIQDPLVGTYSIFGFFPRVYELVYVKDQPPGIVFDGRTRGQIAIIQGGSAGLVVKPKQSQREDEVAKIAGELGAGPRQFPSLPGFLTEEFVAGCCFTELPPERANPASLFQIRRGLGQLLASLHQRQFYYNDTTLSDPSGRSHLLVQPDNSCRLIDFGVSLLLDRHPYVTMEETYNFVRTLPMFQIFSRMGIANEDMARFLQQCQQHLARTPKEEIMARDLRFAEEGLRLAAQRLGEGSTGSLWQGFQEGYR